MSIDATNKPKKDKSIDFQQCLVSGLVGGIIVALIGFVVIVGVYNPYEIKSCFIEHDQSLIMNSDTIMPKSEKQVSIEQQMLFNKLKEQKIILTPNEYTSQLGTYYNSLIAVLIGLFVVFSLVSFFSIKGFAKNEIKEAQLELDQKSAEINQIIKNEVKLVLDEMLRDSKLMHDKLDKYITGIVDDALNTTKSSFPSVELFAELKDEVKLVKQEQETQLDIILEYISDQEHRLKTVKLEENE